MILDDQIMAYHLMRCLILTAMADSVLAEAESEVLEHSVRVLGQIDPELWERTWAELRQDVDPSLVFAEVPEDMRLRRFILREMAMIAIADGQYHAQEERLITLAAESFGLGQEVERFVAWAHGAQAIFEEGEALLSPT